MRLFDIMIGQEPTMVTFGKGASWKVHAGYNQKHHRWTAEFFSNCFHNEIQIRKLVETECLHDHATSWLL